MMRIGYGEGTLLVGDDTARALMTLAAIEAEDSTARSVHLAAIDSGGVLREVDLLIGPATMMTTISETSEFQEPDNSAFEEIVASIVAARHAPVQPESQSPVDTAIDEI